MKSFDFWLSVDLNLQTPIYPSKGFFGTPWRRRYALTWVVEDVLIILS